MYVTLYFPPPLGLLCLQANTDKRKGKGTNVHVYALKAKGGMKVQYSSLLTH